MFVSGPKAAFAAAEAKLTKALSSVPDHARAHLLLGIVNIFTKRAAQGIAECEHALALDRNLARAHAIIGKGKIFVGRAEETEAHVAEALRLSPRDTVAYTWMITRAWRSCILGSWEQAAAWFRRAIEANRNYPSPHFLLGAALAQLGRLDEAHSAVKAGLALSPSFSVSRARAGWTAMSDDPTYLAGLEPILDGLRKAGVPSNDRDPPPGRDPRRRRRRLLASDGRERGRDGGEAAGSTAHASRAVTCKTRQALGLMSDRDRRQPAPGRSVAIFRAAAGARGDRRRAEDRWSWARPRPKRGSVRGQPCRPALSQCDPGLHIGADSVARFGFAGNCTLYRGDLLGDHQVCFCGISIVDRGL